MHPFLHIKAAFASLPLTCHRRSADIKVWRKAAGELCALHFAHLWAVQFNAPSRHWTQTMHKSAVATGGLTRRLPAAPPPPPPYLDPSMIPAALTFTRLPSGATRRTRRANLFLDRWFSLPASADNKLHQSRDTAALPAAATATHPLCVLAGHPPFISASVASGPHIERGSSLIHLTSSGVWLGALRRADLAQLHPPDSLSDVSFLSACKVACPQVRRGTRALKKKKNVVANGAIAARWYGR